MTNLPVLWQRFVASIQRGQTGKLFAAVLVLVPLALSVCFLMPKNVAIAADGQVIKLKTLHWSVEGAIQQAGITLGEKDQVVPGLKTHLSEDMEIQVIRVAEQFVQEQVEIPYPVETRNDPHLEVGEKNIVQRGINGKKAQTVKVTYENGREVKREVVEEKVLSEPQPLVVMVGTKDYIETSRGNVRFKSKVKVEATGYCPCALCCGPYASGWTACGLKAGYGVVSVDPDVIPLGSRLYIEGYGFAVAGDTGSAIHGKIVDLGFDTHSEALSFGRQMLDVYILD